VFGRDQAGWDHPPTEPPLTGARLVDVRLVHTTLGQGGKTDGTASYVAPAGGRNRLRLEARTVVDGHGWKVPIFDARHGKTTFWLGCGKDGPRHTVRWTFALLDDQGQRSNEVVVPLECTGEPMPGAAPRLTAVELTSSHLPLRGRTGGVASVTVTHAPFELVGSITSRGNGWTASSQRVWNDKSFSLACDGITPHVTDVRFRVKDTFGRESEVVEKRLICGDCRVQ
jgi:hypothetical protein